jgi:hypothetical protein
VLESLKAAVVIVSFSCLRWFAVHSKASPVGRAFGPLFLDRQYTASRFGIPPHRIHEIPSCPEYLTGVIPPAHHKVPLEQSFCPFVL